MGNSDSRTRWQTGLFWLASAALTFAIYWLCLRFLYPAYFAPLSPFHPDFYLYAAVRDLNFRVLLFQYPRPAAYAALKILSSGGLLKMMAGGVALALINVLLTLALARRMLRLDTPWLIAAYAVYAVLLFAHPQFYVEHRHDLPAEFSWLFLAVSLLAWMSWVERRRSGARGIAWLAAALLFAVLFAFAKEAYFISALILVLGMAVVNRSERRLHLAFLAFLALIEIASFAWTSHVNSPFVNVSADAAATYHISVAPVSVAKTYWFYLSELLNPFLAALAVLGLIAAASRGRFISGMALLLAGLAAFATLAVLPNHKFEEYAWSAAPLFFAPVLAICRPGFSFGWKTAQVALLAILSVLAVAGPNGYRTEYATDGARWWVAEDQRARAVLSSLDRFQAIPRPARILVSGIEDAGVPWQEERFVRRQFGDRILWTVALPPSVQYRRPSPLVRFVNAADARLADYDYLASYHADGHLTEVRPVQSLPASGDLAETLLPDLAEKAAAVRAAPESYGTMLQCAELCINWGFWPEAGHFLAQAADGAGCDASFQRLSAQYSGRPREAAHVRGDVTGDVTAAITKAELVANPAHIIQPDGSGLGVTEITWNAPAGVSTEIRINSPNGALFAAGGNSGHAVTEKWVKDGTQFFLQDVTGGKPRTSGNTLAVVKVEVTAGGEPASTPALPAARAEFTANPARIVQPDHSGLGSTVLTWKAPAGTAVEIRICSPKGKLFTSGGSTGRAATDKWVTNGMEFFLQDVTGGKPLTSANTLAVARIEVTP